LDHNWTEGGRFAFFVRVSEKLAGFALVRALGMNEHEQNNYSMAEFFIMKSIEEWGRAQTFLPKPYTKFI
jgi:predicted acetyltransferase